MPGIPCLQVDAFTNQPFAGNPAAVCLLDETHSDTWLQSVAAEMNLSETAFVRPVDQGFELRWFTPATEVDLCGHATLATAHALWSEGIVPGDVGIEFRTRSGLLTANRADDFIELDFPEIPVTSAAPPDGLIDSLGVEPAFVGTSKFDKFVLLDSEEAVRSVKPDYARLAEISMRGVIVTAKSADPQFEFVSRFFAPACGVNEDPVCGSAHCTLGPFWSERLGKTKMTAFQASPRGGVLRVRVEGDRVILGGEAVTVLRGELV